MSAEEYFGNWLKVIDRGELDKMVSKLNQLYRTKRVTPEYRDIFKAFNLCKEEDCKVIIIGQDVYPQAGVGTGVAFANKRGTRTLSPSLRVLVDSARRLCDDPFPGFDITLESWERQGALLINSALTCEVDRPGSHIGIWMPFIGKFLKNMSSTHPNMVYVLLGNDAQSLSTFISHNSHILKYPHPAFYARKGEEMPSEMFLKVNDILRYHYNTTIEWCAES